MLEFTKSDEEEITMGVKYVAVLTRAIPVEGYCTDTLVKVLNSNDTLETIYKWADKECSGQCGLVKLELCRDKS